MNQQSILNYLVSGMMVMKGDELMMGNGMEESLLIHQQ